MQVIRRSVTVSSKWANKYRQLLCYENATVPLKYTGIYYPIYNIYRYISSDILYTGRFSVPGALTFAVIWYCYPLSTVHRSRIEVRDVLWFFHFVFNLINTNVDYKDYEQLNLLQRRFNYKLNGKHHSVSQILSYFHRRNIFSSNVIIC